MIAAVLDDNELAAENSPMDLDKFDDDMLDMYVINLGQGHLLTLASLSSIHIFEKSSSLKLLGQSK